jgi:hypothetical protein
MPSSADKRMAKYEAKYDGVTVGARFTAGKALAVDAFNLTAPVLAGLEGQVKADILAVITPAIPAYQIPAYLAFMRQCYAKARKYGGGTLVLECQSTANSWAQKGLDATALMAIAALFGATITTPH